MFLLLFKNWIKEISTPQIKSVSQYSGLVQNEK